MAGESNVVVFHEGRRYRRADCKDGGAVSIGRQSRTQRVSQQRIQPHPPPYGLRDRGILPAEACPSQNVAYDHEPSPSPTPFQRYKPLPPIGSTPNVSLCPLVNTPHHSSSLDLRSTNSESVTVCVRLPDGSSRSEVTLPLSSPLSSVVTAALSGTETEAWRLEDQGWVLCTSEVPKRELHDLSLSLQEAGVTTPSILHLLPS